VLERGIVVWGGADGFIIVGEPESDQLSAIGYQLSAQSWPWTEVIDAGETEKLRAEVES